MKCWAEGEVSAPRIQRAQQGVPLSNLGPTRLLQSPKDLGWSLSVPLAMDCRTYTLPLSLNIFIYKLALY